MKFIFFGSPEFAAIILEKLIKASLLPQAVACNPDKPVGRKKIITPPPTKLVIRNQKIENGIEILQPEKLDNHLITQLLNHKPDFFIVAAYSKIIPKEILEIPHFGTIGIHPSLLPKHRGPTPIQTAILNGDKETGTTLFLMDEKIDHGLILATSHLPITTNDNYETLMRKLAELSANLLIETLSNIKEKIKNAKPQNESEATYTKKFKTEDAFINPEDLEKTQKGEGKTAAEIDRKIRALNPEPGTFTVIKGKRIKLLEAKIKDNKLKLVKIQKEGKKPQIINNFIESL
ncbi:MAG: methionyl-tRNA formyltransferase [Patescibacteria group bacterium]